MSAVLRRPLLAVPVILTALTGLGILGVAVGALVANPERFGVGVALMLTIYGAALIAIAWLVARGQRWALGLIVASSLLHAMVVYSLMGTDDRAQFIGTLVVAPFVLATVVTSVVAVGRGEMEKA
ncbi:hypothetical protein GCM10025789_18280 [Tessaracoccus lubricantis]|uniref:Histidine kinase n=1 Tax=Tessaracoccus lubricantis TaxID=545543 RepID=A0ABP9FFQ9_9ACTN